MALVRGTVATTRYTSPRDRRPPLMLMGIGAIDPDRLIQFHVYEISRIDGAINRRH